MNGTSCFFANATDTIYFCLEFLLSTFLTTIMAYFLLCHPQPNSPYLLLCHAPVRLIPSTITFITATLLLPFYVSKGET